MKTSEKIKCPVCGKEDISDYHKEDVICPCCGTDLSIYRLIADSQEHSTSPHANNKNWKIATAVSAAIAILALVYVCLSKQQEFVQNVELTNKVEILKDSISSLTSQLESANQEIANLKVQSADSPDKIYVVKKNDSPCKISRKLYGTESRYKEIEAIITKPLQPGDTLKIK